MARACSVCSHAQHLDIDAALLGAGTARLSHREVAVRYGLSRASVQRHAVSHIAPIMRAVTEQAGLLHAESMLSELGRLYERAIRNIDRAEAGGEPNEVSAALREARSSIETFAKIGLAMAQREEPEEDRRSDLDDRIEEALRNRAHRGVSAIGPGGPVDPLSDDQVEEAVVIEVDHSP